MSERGVVAPRGRRSAAACEAGFTLVELLVVVIIIGILAAIAIPSYLNHRQTAYDAAVGADLRYLATVQIGASLAGTAGFVDTVAELRAEGFIPSSDAAEYGVCSYNGGADYIVGGIHASGTVIIMGSQVKGPAPGSVPADLEASMRAVAGGCIPDIEAA